MIETQINAADLNWHVRQDGDGPDLVCIHGAGASLESWDALVPLLETEFRVTRMDLPGHADSESFRPGLYSLRRTAQAVAALCHTLELEAPLVLGHSAGGAIGLKWSLDGHAPRPGRILAINPALLPFSGVAGLMFPAMARFAAMLPLLDGMIARRAERTTEVRRLLEGTGSQLHGPDVARYQALMARPSHVRAVIEMMAGWRLDGLIDEWRQTDGLLSIILGGRDRAVPPTKTAAALRDVADVTLIEDVGHLAHEERPHLVAEWLRAQTGLSDEQCSYG
ncbi:MAG: alpha/beta fold hydrolase BchO [Pseudomonadota bacterium]